MPTLTPPTYLENLWTNHILLSRYRLPRGITLAVKGNKVFELTYPYQGDLGQYDRVYRGGHVHEITDEEAAVLIAAGYGAFIS
jgi:hypothetical protein